MDRDEIFGYPDEDSLFWFLVLEKHGGFLRGPAWDIQRVEMASLVERIVKRNEQGMKLIPIGRKDLQT